MDTTTPLLHLLGPSRLPDTVSQCHVLISELTKTVGQLTSALEGAMARIATLEEQLKLNSRNSSKPPSSDSPGQRGHRAKRPPSARKRGGQPGHQGHCREILPESEVDQVVNCSPPTHCACGGEIVSHGRAGRHQVFELPVIKPIVTEYRCQGGRCSQCGLYQSAPLPVGVPRGQLGPRGIAMIATLSSQFQVTQNKLKPLLADLFGLRFSLGCLSASHGITAQALEPA